MYGIQRERESVEAQVYTFQQEANEWHLFAVTLIIIPASREGPDPLTSEARVDLSQHTTHEHKKHRVTVEIEHFVNDRVNPHLLTLILLYVD